MLISNSHRFIYVHLHKCAGSSVEFALSDTLEWNDLLLGSTPYGERLMKLYSPLFGLHKHSTAMQVRDKVGAALWQSYYSFSTVRNPYTLATSQYTYSLREMRRGLHKARQEKEKRGDTGQLKLKAREWPWTYPGVKALMANRWGKTSFPEFIRSPHLRGWTGFQAMRPQLCDEHGALLVNEFFKLEELERQWPLICERLGLPGIALGRDNASLREDVDPRILYADEDDVRIIRDLFAEDFGFFGYDEAL